jgi:hypothetical protein
VWCTDARAVASLTRHRSVTNEASAATRQLKPGVARQGARSRPHPGWWTMAGRKEERGLYSKRHGGCPAVHVDPRQHGLYAFVLTPSPVPLCPPSPSSIGIVAHSVRFPNNAVIYSPYGNLGAFTMELTKMLDSKPFEPLAAGGADTGTITHAHQQYSIRWKPTILINCLRPSTWTCSSATARRSITRSSRSSAGEAVARRLRPRYSCSSSRASTRDAFASSPCTISGAATRWSRRPCRRVRVCGASPPTLLSKPGAEHGPLALFS